MLGAAVLGLWQAHRILAFDALRLFAPYYTLIADFAAAGRLLLWDPWSNCGSPLHAYVEMGSYSPLTVAHAWLTGGGYLGFQLYWLAIWGIGGIGLLALARHLGAPIWAGLAVAISFCFSGFWLGHATHTSWLYAFAFLPWIVWRVDVSLGSGRWWPSVEAGALYGLSALAGHPALVVNNGLFVAGWVFARLAARGFAPRAIAGGGLALAIVVSVGGIVMSPAYVGFLVDAAGYADRVGALDRAIAVSDQQLPPLALATLASPYLPRLGVEAPELFAGTWAGLAACYVGALIPALALFALVRQPRDRFGAWIALLGLLYLACALGDLLPLRGWLYDLLPPARYFRHTAVFRAHFLFALAVLALLGARTLAADRDPTGAWRRLAGISAALGATAVIAFAATLAIAPKPAPGIALAVGQLVLVWAGLPVVCLLVASPARRRFAAGALLGLVGIDALLSLTTSVPLMTISIEGVRLDPSRRNRTLDLTEHGLFRDGDPRHALGNRHLSTRTPTVESFNTLNHHFHTRSGVGTAGWRNLPESWSDVGVLRSAISGDLSRTWFASEVAEVAPSDRAFAAYVARAQELEAPPIVIHPRDAMSRAGATPADQDADAHAAARIAQLPAAQRVPVEVQGYSPTRLAFSVDSPASGWLLVTDRWARGWRASVDGQPAEVWGGSFLFRALRVGPGRHEVELRYVPYLYPWLLVASWATLALVITIGSLRGRVAAGAH